MKKPRTKAGKKPRPAQPSPEDKEAAALVFPYVEPRWPGTLATWPAPAPLAEIVACSMRWLDTAFKAGNRGSRGNAVALCAFAARRLIEWLAATAASDTDEARNAQGEIFDLAGRAAAQLDHGFRAGWPVAKDRAQKATAVPGFVSRNPTVNLDTQILLVEIGQGRDVPSLLRKPGKKTRHPRVIDSPAQLLVGCVHDYMGDLRAPWRKAFPGEWIACVAPRVREILDLPPLDAGTVKKWEAVSWEILTDFSPRRDPANLPALQSALLRPLLTAGAPLREAHRKAWKALGT